MFKYANFSVAINVLNASFGRYLWQESFYDDILLGRVVQSPIKLTKGWPEFWFQFCDFLVRCSVYIVCPSVLSYCNLKLHQKLEEKNIFKQENVILQLTLNPGLPLTGFWTTRSWCISFSRDERACLYGANEIPLFYPGSVVFPRSGFH